MKKIKAVKFYEVVEMGTYHSKFFLNLEGRPLMEMDYSPKANMVRLKDEKSGMIKYVTGNNIVYMEFFEDWLTDKIAVDPRAKK